MISLGGEGGDFADSEFCDTSIKDPGSDDGESVYSWWKSFAEGKRFYVPDVARLNNQQVTNFNVTALTDHANRLLERHPSHYPHSTKIGRKTFDKLLENEAMSFAKAVIATRTINADLKARGVKDADGNLVQIGKHRIIMSGYRVEGLSAALSCYEHTASRSHEDESAGNFLAREAEVAEFIVEALHADDSKFVVYPTAVLIIHALLRNRHRFGISNSVTEQVFLRLGPLPNTSFSRIDLRFSVPETGDKLDARKDPKFSRRTLAANYPPNPFQQAG